MQQQNSTLEGIEKQVSQKLAKMYKSMPNAEIENKLERDLAIRLGGSLAAEFFK